MKKRLFALLLTLVVCLSASIPAFAAATLPIVEEGSSLPILSELPDDELLLFLEEHEVAIPVGFAESQAQALEIIRSFIVDIEQNPAVEFAYSLSQLHDLAYALKSAVNNYYGTSAGSILVPYANHGLRDSTVYQVPSNMGNYNCYAYALGIISLCNPSSFNGHSMTQATLKNMSVYEIAQYVKEDLQSSSFNKKCVKITYGRPSSSSLVSGQTAICVRKGDNGANKYDYHFMRLFSGNAWRHKPGGTAILTYDYLPSNSRDWTNEHYNGSIAQAGSIVYDSSIYYILFKSSHSYSHIYTGYNYHSGSKHYYEYADICTGCGDKKANTSTWYIINCSGPPCVDIMHVGVTDK